MPGEGDPTKARLMGTREFLLAVGKAGGFRKDVAAFQQRWVAGQGCPHLLAAYAYHKYMAFPSSIVSVRHWKLSCVLACTRIASC